MNDSTTMVHSNVQAETGEPLSMTSLEVADLVESNHTDVRRSIERLAERGVIQLPPSAKVKNKQSLSPNNKVKAYIFEGEGGKRDSYIVVAQLCPEFTARLVDRWQELEEQVARPALPDFGDPVAAARAWADAKEAQQLALSQRDEAIATKAEIGSRREATAMATASRASREASSLRRELGQHAQTACILAVQKLTGEKFKFHPLKKWCVEHGRDIHKVEHPVYGSVNSYCAEAWLEVYGVVLADLFPASHGVAA